MITKETGMTDAAPVQMPQRYNWDPIDYCTVESVPHPTGYWVDADDVEPLVAEINRLRDKLVKARRITDELLKGVQDHYTCMSDVRADLWILQSVLKD